jgi:serine/threonine-protein kinase RsbW
VLDSLCGSGRASAARERRPPYILTATTHQGPGMYEHTLPASLQRSWEQSYPGTAGQLRHVRSALRQFLGSCPVADDAVSLLSELAANAVLHSDSGNSGGTFTVRAQHADGYVRCEVEDQGSDWHGELSAATRPHGLFLLLNLASACGVERFSRAHLVWFRLDYPKDLT